MIDLGAPGRLRQRRHARAAQERTTLAGALQPVAESLRRLAENQATAELADAEADAALVVEAADREASELLATARRDGRVAGERVRASELAFARRQAREMILQAQRRAFEALRVAAHGELVRQAPSDRGQELTRLIERNVRERVGSPVATHPEELGPLGALAEHHKRRAALGTLALIDAELERMPHAIEALWT